MCTLFKTKQNKTQRKKHDVDKEQQSGCLMERKNICG